MNDRIIISLFKASVVALLVLVALAISIAVIIPIDDPVRWPPKSLNAVNEDYLPEVNEFLRILQPYQHFTFYFDLRSHKLLLHNDTDMTEPMSDSFTFIATKGSCKLHLSILDLRSRGLIAIGKTRLKLSAEYNPMHLRTEAEPQIRIVLQALNEIPDAGPSIYL